MYCIRRVFNSSVCQRKPVSIFLEQKKKFYIVFNADRLPQRVGLKQDYYLYTYVYYKVYELGRYISGIYGVKGSRHIGGSGTSSQCLQTYKCVMPMPISSRLDFVHNTRERE